MSAILYIYIYIDPEPLRQLSLWKCTVDLSLFKEVLAESAPRVYAISLAFLSSFRLQEEVAVAAGAGAGAGAGAAGAAAAAAAAAAVVVVVAAAH